MFCPVNDDKRGNQSSPVRASGVKAKISDLEDIWDGISRRFLSDGQLSPEFAVVVPCPCCGSREVRDGFALKGFSHGTCCDCGTVYVSPRLTDDCLEELYSADYYDALYNTSLIPMFDQRVQMIGRSKFAEVVRHRGTDLAGRVLDIGAGIGEVLEVFHQSGWSTHAIEMNGVAADWLASRGHDQVFRGPLGSDGSPSGPFEVVMAWGVVEHVVDPDDFLRQVRALLAPGGLFVSEVPNGQSLLVDVVRETGLDPGRIVMGEQHITLYSETAYRRVHERNGLKPVHIQTNGLDVSTVLERSGVEVPDWLLRAVQGSIDTRGQGDLLRGFWTPKPLEV